MNSRASFQRTGRSDVVVPCCGIILHAPGRGILEIFFICNGPRVKLLSIKNLTPLRYATTFIIKYPKPAQNPKILKSDLLLCPNLKYIVICISIAHYRDRNRI